MVYFPFVLYSVKCSSDNFPHITKKGIKDYLAKETGRDRVIRMYSTNEFGFSPELKYVIKTGTYSFMFASFFGAVGGITKARDDFFRKNMASTYESKHLARRSLTDTMSLAGIGAGIRTGVKYGGFTTLYLLSVMTVANYRNKITVWEHVGSAAVLGGLTKINYGFKGMLVAGGLGGVLGLVTGGIITLVMRYGGHTMDDFRCYLHEDYYTVRNRRIPSEDKE